MNYAHSPLRQRGASLFISLIMLVALTLIALGSLSTSVLELRMANNTESSTRAFQMAQAAIDASVATPDQFYIVKGTVGNTNCFNISGCADTISSMPVPISASNNSLRITRVTEETCPPRTRNTATSCASQRASSFVAESTFDHTLAGMGKSDLAQGYIRLIPVVDDRTVGAGTGATQN